MLRADKIEIYVGLETKSGKPIAQAAVSEFVAKACPKGAFTTFGTGQWEGVSEPAACITIIQNERHDEENGAYNTARWVAEHYQSQFNQALVIWFITAGARGQTTSQASYVRR